MNQSPSDLGYNVDLKTENRRHPGDTKLYISQHQPSSLQQITANCACCIEIWRQCRLGAKSKWT